MKGLSVSKLKAGIFALAACTLGGLAVIQAGSLSVRFSDPNFKHVAYEVHFHGKPYTGVAYERHPNGRLGRLGLLWKGRQVLKEYQWHSNGNRLAESTYDLQGRRQGDWMMWHPDGKPKSLTHYINDRRHGEQWAWHPNGTLVEYNVHEEDRTITHKTWIFDGTPFYNYVYQDGAAIGVKGGDFCRPQGLISLNRILKK